MNAMRSNGIRKKITYLVVLAGIFFLITSCTPMLMRIEKEPWFVSANDYVEGYELPHKSAASQKEKESLAIAQIERAKKNYLNSRQPTAEEILAVLNSQDNEKTKIGLGAMALQPLSEYEVLKKMIIFFDHPSEIHRDLARLALVEIHRNEIGNFQDLGDMIFECANRTNDDYVLSFAIQILGKFNNQKYLPFIIKYLRKHDNLLFYYSSFNALKEMDDKYVQQVRRQLEREGDTETLKKFDQSYNFWKKYGNDSPSDSCK